MVPGETSPGVLMTSTFPPTTGTFDATTPAFLLEVDVDAGTIAVHGDFDRGRADEFLDAVRRLLDSPSPSWSIDVSAVTFCDAGGLRALLAAHRLAEQNGRTLHVTQAGRWMRRLLPMIGLTPSGDPVRGLRLVG